MTTTLATRSGNSVIEKVVIEGDLGQLDAGERLNYYRSVCNSLGLNPLTKPFDYIRLNGRLVLYAKRDATDQLRKIHGVSVAITSRERIEDVYVVSAKASTKDGREDESIGAVNILNLKGDALANALMKAETKAKRRVTLSIVGLGWLDETEVETIPDARTVAVDTSTGEVIESPKVAEPLKTNGESKPGNGNGKPYKFPSHAAEKFYIEAQKNTGNFYHDGAHLEKTIGGWFNFGSQDLWDEKMSVAVDYVRNLKEAEQAQLFEAETPPDTTHSN